MAVSAVVQLAEQARRAASGDDRYASKGGFIFVLRGPPGAGPIPPTGRAQFPLVINPDTYEYRLPFAAEITALQEGGVVAEEGGITIGEIQLAGTTGFKIRTNPNDLSGGRGDGKFTGQLDPGKSAVAVFDGVSGHMHFWRLAGRCFDGYSALKKDPRHASQTHMEFHDLKNDLHLMVVPREFVMSRNANRERVTFRYEIRLAVVGQATNSIRFRSPDTSMLQKFKNTIAEMRNAVQSIQAEIDDLTASLDDIRRTIVSAAGIIDDVANVMDAATDLITGAKRFLDIPATVLSSTASLVASAGDLAAAEVSLPLAVAQSFYRISDSIDQIKVAARDHFREPLDDIARRYEALTGGYQQGRDPIRDTQTQALKASADAGEGRLTVEQVFGGQIRPGDVVRGRSDPAFARARLQAGRFHGYEERIINQGDTVESLAAKYMGDARDWVSIVAANQLHPPYITAGAQIPGTLQVGDRIIIPIDQSFSNPDTLTTGAARLGDSQAEALLGVDFERVQLADGTFGWAIDAAHGSVDARKVAGVANLGQGVDGRLRTVQGENILYPQFGLPRIVGQRGFETDLVTFRYEARNQLLADPRIERIASLAFTQNGDSLEIEADVKPVGFTSSRTIARTLT